MNGSFYLFFLNVWRIGPTFGIVKHKRISWEYLAVRVNLGPALKEENNQEGEGKIHGMKIVATSGIQYLGAPVSMI